MIKAVLFDYGGVLTKGGTAGGMTRLVAGTLGIPVGEAAHALPLLRDLLLGHATTEQFLQRLGEMYPNAPQAPTKEHLRQSADIFIASQPVYDLARALRGHGVRTAILSNMFGLSAEELREKGFYDGFDPVILSYQEHIAKPDPDIYHRALEKLQVSPEEVLFVDDQERFLEPARELGMPCVRADSPAQIVADVRRIVQESNGIRLP